jgi:phage terminase large subunit-like protein
VDFATVTEDVLALAQRFRYKEVGADDYQATSVLQQFQAAGIACVAVPQTYKGMNEGCKELEGLVRSQKIRHPDNPVLNWCMQNVQLRMDSATQHVRPIRPSHDLRLKIDGVVALVMALGRAIRHQNAKSLYDDPDYEPVYVEMAS